MAFTADEYAQYPAPDSIHLGVSGTFSKGPDRKPLKLGESKGKTESVTQRLHITREETDFVQIIPDKIQNVTDTEYRIGSKLGKEYVKAV